MIEPATGGPQATATPTRLTTVRFAVIGDYGYAGEPAAGVADLVLTLEPEFIVTTGDNNYPDGELDTIDDHIGRYYAGFIAPYEGSYGPGAVTNRFFPSPGNHDWNSAGLQPYLAYFTLPGNERYYDFTWGPLHLIAVDSDSREPDGVSAGSVQAHWLRETLAGSEAPWKIVYMHHPPYSSGYHGSVEWMRWPFQEWGASAVLAGHDHLYERLDIDGLPLFINGLGGYPARYGFQEILPESRVRYNDDYGAMLVVATPDEITFRFITWDGKIIDTYTLAK